jgi:hypothetical protein
MLEFALEERERVTGLSKHDMRKWRSNARNQNGASVQKTTAVPKFLLSF